MKWKNFAFIEPGKQFPEKRGMKKRLRRAAGVYVLSSNIRLPLKYPEHTGNHNNLHNDPEYHLHGTHGASSLSILHWESIAMAPLSCFRLALLLLCACCWPSLALRAPVSVRCPDPSDCTSALQLALDAGSPLRLSAPGPFITRMLHVTRSDVSIECDPGVLLLAKRWHYNATGDSLLTVSNAKNFAITGCTLRMWRDDYANPLWYKKGEWRMALSLLNVSAAFISNCSFEESGGDGLYLGGTCNEDIVLRGSAFKGNYRQGLSVICCERLAVNDCTFEDTRGTNPQCGVDFEPDTPQQRLINVSFSNTKFRNNSGCQIAISTYALTSNSTPISIFFQETSASVTDGYGILISIPHSPAADSYITFVDTNVSDSSKVLQRSYP